jgi:hypothetical protein
MQIKYIPFFLSAALWLSGCSMHAWYEGMKIGAENECRKQQPSAVEDCLSRINKKSYEEYEKERSAR